MRLCCALVLATACLAADKAPLAGAASNMLVRVEATAYLDKASIQKALGAELTDGIIVIEVKVTPGPGRKHTIDRDNFLLRSDRDGQRTTPYAPSQIAGSSTLTVRTTGGGGPGVMSEDQGPAWGGIGGRPRRLPGSGAGIGNVAGVEETTATVAEASGKQKTDPLLDLLKQKVLPEQEISEPVSGQLYFLLEGKHKPKDLELLYQTGSGRLSIRFK